MSNTQLARPAIFLDRDGVLNIDKAYVGSWADFEWIAGAKALITRYKRAGWLVVVVTNQSGIARGFYSANDVEALHRSVNADLTADERIDAFYYCPYHKDAVINYYRVANHGDRKPNPGMILRASQDLSIDLPSSVMIGDKPSDMVAAERAGVHGALFKGGNVDLFAREAFGELNA